ncbi:MAG: hypothetical protein VYD28_06275 [SAR324 cluster bacterium]|nr:hypothetical protein [SAR324 cluster bacterium]
MWWKMLALICGGSTILIALNWDTLPIGLASATAFLAAGVGGSLVYAGLRKTFHHQGKWFKFGRQRESQLFFQLWLLGCSCLKSCWDSLLRNLSGAFCGHLYCKNFLAKTKQKFNLPENKS